MCKEIRQNILLNTNKCKRQQSIELIPYAINHRLDLSQRRSINLPVVNLGNI